MTNVQVRFHAGTGNNQFLMAKGNILTNGRLKVPAGVTGGDFLSDGLTNGYATFEEITQISLEPRNG